MSSTPLVSVIIIFLNEERFLQEAIDSVFAQTYAHWELLLVDDGSTDDSPTIAQACAAAHPNRVRYLTHPQRANRGMSASRALGVYSARGAYLSYIDGDDVWLPNKLTEQVAILDKLPDVDMTFGPLQMWHSWTGNPEDVDYLNGVSEDGHFPFANQVVDPPRMLNLFLRDERYMPSGFLVRTAVMQTRATYEPQFVNAYSDGVALVKLCLESKVFVSDRCHYRYRKHEASFTYQSWLHDWGADEQKLYWEWVEQYLASVGAENSGAMKIVRKGLQRFRRPRQFKARRQLRRWTKRIAPTLYQWIQSQRRATV